MRPEVVVRRADPKEAAGYQRRDTGTAATLEDIRIFGPWGRVGERFRGQTESGVLSQPTDMRPRLRQGASR